MPSSSRPGSYRIAAPAVAAPKSAPPSAGTSTLDTAFRLWCLHEALKLLHEPTWSPWVLACGVAVAAAAVAPRQPLVALALTLRLCDTAMLMPFCWDSFYWCFQIDGGLLLLLLCAASADRDAVARSWAEICRLQLSLFYASAAWWKLNTSFLDPRTSPQPRPRRNHRRRGVYRPPPRRRIEPAAEARSVPRAPAPPRHLAHPLAEQRDPLLPRDGGPAAGHAGARAHGAPAPRGREEAHGAAGGRSRSRGDGHPMRARPQL
mmetsp:Transcript_13047/g.43418  ORF Transcript_13047/g.43418 Transcript_13047/m.43418 type:complete len:262 (+) Transcript_13047:30-815(+)